MTVVSNTSPITNLASIDQIHLLREIYGAILIPQAVYDELIPILYEDEHNSAPESLDTKGL